MKKLPYIVGICLPALMLLSQPISANDEHREHDAHEHGTALLNVAIEENSLHIEFESPAMNIVGFEHKANSGKNKLAIKNAVNRLKQGESLFITPEKAQCKLAHAEIESSLIEKTEEHEEHNETHSEFHVSYVFNCNNISALTTINTQIFNLFRGSEKILAQIISNTGQTQKELTPSQHILNF
ncbi:MAG: DUF2796 domain-containing protein [Gammaproteobacteria bacterium]|nr:DUF2796 domain-containing protein [Gammaproteobacteria bacterium]